MKRLDISVVTYNSEKWVKPFFESLLRQNFPCGCISLYFRDNGSTDGTLSLLEESANKFADQFSLIHIERGKNIGFGAGHNFNLQRVESDFFLVSNIDLEFEESSLEVLLVTAEKDAPEVAAWECRQKPFEHPKHYDPVTSETLWCSSACVLFRTAAIRKIGGYEKRIFMYGEDVELSYRLRDHGYRLRYVPKSVVWHHSYEESNQIKPLQFLGSTQANVLLRCRYGRWDEVLLGFCMYLGLFLVPSQFPRQKRQLFLGFLQVIRKAPFFLLTRKQSLQKFGFRLWDYEMVREGAFHEHVPYQQDAPLVSIIVRTTPGRSGRLREALVSVDAQTYRHIELVVVEDGGDSAREMVVSYVGSGRFDNIIYLPQAKVGRCAAGNAALAAATGELICFLDDDDLFYADHVEVLAGEWLKNKKLGAVYGLAFEVKTKIKTYEPWVYSNEDYGVVHRQKFNRALMWHHNYLPIQTVLFRRDLYLKHGGFDAQLDNLEDWNLWVRYSLHDDFLMVPKVTSLYRVPYANAQALERQKVLDDYYGKARQKHSELRVELSPTDVLKMAEDLSRELYLVNVPAHRLRALVLRAPGLRSLYHPLRHMYHLLRKARGRSRS